MTQDTEGTLKFDSLGPGHSQGCVSLVDHISTVTAMEHQKG